MSKIESKWSNPTGLFALVGLLFAGLLPANVALAADEEVAVVSAGDPTQTAGSVCSHK